MESWAMKELQIWNKSFFFFSLLKQNGGKRMKIFVSIFLYSKIYDCSVSEWPCFCEIQRGKKIILKYSVGFGSVFFGSFPLPWKPKLVGERSDLSEDSCCGCAGEWACCLHLQISVLILVAACQAQTPKAEETRICWVSAI